MGIISNGRQQTLLTVQQIQQQQQELSRQQRQLDGSLDKLSSRQSPLRTLSKSLQVQNGQTQVSNYDQYKQAASWLSKSIDPTQLQNSMSQMGDMLPPQMSQNFPKDFQVRQPNSYQLSNPQFFTNRMTGSSTTLDAMLLDDAGSILKESDDAISEIITQLEDFAIWQEQNPDKTFDESGMSYQMLYMTMKALMDQRAQMVNMIANIMKIVHDTVMNTARNLKS